MDITESITLPQLAQKRKMQKQLTAFAVVAVGLATAEMYNSTVTKWLRYCKRSMQASFAAWVEEQGGLPLFTVEGDEPEEARTSWNLPLAAIPAAPYGTSRPSEGAGVAMPQAPVRQASFGSDGSSNSSEVPNFFASTKFFSCLDLKESQELFEATQMVRVAAGETLFSVGDSSAPGIFIVVEGRLGVFLEDGLQRLQTNVLHAGETVGDLDVLDGATRSATVIALEGGALLTQVSRELFMQFIASKPRTLQIYLHKAIARLWRVAHFMLSDFLNLAIEDVSAGEVSLQAALCPAASPHVFVTAPPVVERPWQAQPAKPREQQRTPSSASTAAYAPGPSSLRFSSGVADAPSNRPRGKAFASKLSAVSEATTDSSAASASSAATSFSAAVGQPPAMASPFSAWAAQRQRRRSRHSDEDETSSVDSLSQHGSVPTSPHARDPISPISNPRTSKDDASPAASPKFPEGKQQEAEDPPGGTPKLAGKSYAAVVADGSQAAQDDVAACGNSSVNHRADDASASDAAPAASQPSTHSSTASAASLSHYAAAPAESSSAQSASTSSSAAQPPLAQPATMTAAEDKAEEAELASLLATAMAALPTSSSSSSSAKSGSSQSPAKPNAALRTLARAVLEEGNAAAVKDALKDSEIAHSIRTAMERQRQMSLPLALLHISSSHDNLPDFLKEEKASMGGVQGAGTESLHRMHSIRHGGLNGPQASLSTGWDVVTPDDCLLTNYSWALLSGQNGMQPHAKRLGHRFSLRKGQLLQAKDASCRQFFVLIEGNLLAERPKRDGTPGSESGFISPGSLLGTAAYLTSTRSRASVRALGTCRIVGFGVQELDNLVAVSSPTFVELLLAASRALCPIIRRFLSLGLNRVWLTAGDTAYRQGDAASSLFVVISGRLRLVRQDPSSKPPVRVEEEVGRGEPLGAVWALTGGLHDTTALCIRDSELVRMSKHLYKEVSSLKGPSV